MNRRIPWSLTHAVIIFAAALVEIAVPGPAQPCTTLIAGRGTTVDGSIFYIKTEDDSPRDIDYLWYVPRRNHRPGSVVRLHAGGTIPEVPETFAYVWDEPPGTPYSSALVNEWGVAFGSNGCTSREDDVDTVESRGDLVDGGLGFRLRMILAERCRTAREAVELAAHLIDTYGYNASGRNLNIVGPREAWQLQMVRGKQYVARRVQDDEVAVIANTFSIRAVDTEDRENFVCSPRLIDYAVERGWYDPSSGRPFDFAEAYADPERHTHPGNTLRHWDMCRLLIPDFQITAEAAQTGILPVSVKPKKKLHLEDLMAIFRDHYEGTLPFGAWQEKGTDPHGTEFAPICNRGTHRVTLVQQRDWLPTEIGTVNWRLLDKPCSSAYVPWYPGTTQIPQIFRQAPESFYETEKDLLEYHFNMPPETWFVDTGSASSLFKLLGRLVVGDYAKCHDPVRSRWDTFQRKTFRLQDAVERAALDLYRQDPALAKEYLSAYTMGLALESLEIARELIETCPRSVGVHLSLGTFYFEAGRLDRALESFDRAAAASPGDPSAEKRAEWVRMAIGAKQDPPEVPPATLRRYAGDYGPRHVSLEGNTLHYRRDGGVETRLLPISLDTFELEGYPAYRVRFVTSENGRISKLVLLGFDGEEDRSLRDGH